MIERKFDAPKLSVWTVAKILFNNVVEIIKKNSVGCKCHWKVLKGDKISEKVEKFF